MSLNPPAEESDATDHSRAQLDASVATRHPTGFVEPSGDEPARLAAGLIPMVSMRTTEVGRLVGGSAAMQAVRGASGIERLAGAIQIPQIRIPQIRIAQGMLAAGRVGFAPALDAQQRLVAAWSKSLLPTDTLTKAIGQFVLPSDCAFRRLVQDLLPRPDVLSSVWGSQAPWQWIFHHLAQPAERAMSWFRHTGAHAALEARQAVLRGDLEAVAIFVRDWLRMRPEPRRVQAAVDVLLADDWLAVPLDETISYLARQLRRRYQDWRLILDRGRRLRGQPVLSLDQPVETNTGVVWRYEQVAACGDIGDPVVEALTIQALLAAVMGHLTLEERRIVQARADTGAPWSQLALSLGLPANRGEAVSRKLRRLGAHPHLRNLYEGLLGKLCSPHGPYVTRP